MSQGVITSGTPFILTLSVVQHINTNVMINWRNPKYKPTIVRQVIYIGTSISLAKNYIESNVEWMDINNSSCLNTIINKYRYFIDGYSHNYILRRRKGKN